MARARSHYFPDEMNSPSSTFEKMILILQFVAEKDYLVTTEEIAQSCGLNTSTTLRYVRKLLADGMLVQLKQTGHVSIGPAALRLGTVLRRHLAIDRLARPIMQELVQQLDETVTLNIYSTTDRLGICIAIEECKKSLQYALELGETKALHSGASGKTILAFLDPEERDQVLRTHPLTKFTSRTITNGKKLVADLQKIRVQGWCLSKGERLAGAIGIGAPVFNSEDSVVASMVVTIPEHRFKQEDFDILRTRLLRSTHDLSYALGWKNGTQPA